MNRDLDFTVDIFCRIVDNYGDAGVVLRLAKGLFAAAPGLTLRLIVDDLEVFGKLCPEIDPLAEAQRLKGWTLIRRDHVWEGFRRRPAQVIIDSLGCGFPDHYDGLLRERAGPKRFIIHLEYLSAEAYSEEFHRLPSLTPYPGIKKYFFTPGFTSRTGGLVLDPSFLAKKRFWYADTRRADRRRLKIESGAWGSLLPKGGKPSAENRFWVAVFSYEQNFGPLMKGLAAWERPKLVLLAEGPFRAEFLSVWEAAGKPFPIGILPFLSQDAWDDLLLACDLLLIRGEESLSRAALSGIPFLWQAYRQEAGYQRVKVAALLDRMAIDFPDKGVFTKVRDAFELYNTDSAVPIEAESPSAGAPYTEFLRHVEEAASGYRAFAKGLEENGDLAEHLLNFLDEIM